MTTQGRAVGRPMHSPQRILEAQELSFLRNLDKSDGPDGHWICSVTAFKTLDRKRITNRRYAWNYYYPTDQVTDLVEIHKVCGIENCVQPQHLAKVKKFPHTVAKMFGCTDDNAEDVFFIHIANAKKRKDDKRVADLLEILRMYLHDKKKYLYLHKDEPTWTVRFERFISAEDAAGLDAEEVAKLFASWGLYE